MRDRVGRLSVTGIRYLGMIHGFASMGGVLVQGKLALAEADAGLRWAFGQL